MDLRRLLDYDTGYTDGPDLSCTYCVAFHEDYTEREGTVIVKRHWANRPLGQLVTYCPWHAQRTRTPIKTYKPYPTNRLQEP